MRIYMYMYNKLLVFELCLFRLSPISASELEMYGERAIRDFVHELNHSTGGRQKTVT